MNDLVWAALVFAGVAASQIRPSSGWMKKLGKIAEDTHRGMADDYHQDRRLDPGQSVNRRLKKEKIGEAGKYGVFLVDGTEIRNNVDPDFIGGGNPSRYPYVPHGEVWVERGTPPQDVVCYAHHEEREAELMRRRGLSYGDAHTIAVRLELRLRRDPKKRRALEKKMFGK